MTPALVAVDWGTTNRRVFVLDADGGVVETRVDDAGVLAVSDFPAEIAALRAAAGGAPLLLAGMIGSNRGWVEAPYVAAPAGLGDLAAASIRPLPGVTIIPGVAQRDPARPDVMRGEEVQLLGLASDGLFCHPGTHSKWVTIANARITGFRTVMTGDLMAALTARSILSDLLAQPADDDDAFAAGVDTMLGGGDLTAELFGVRARVLTAHLPASSGSSRVSGLLIGADVVAGLRGAAPGPVILVGAPNLCRLFDMALQRAGRSSVTINGETAFVAGAHALAAEIAVHARHQ
jgi:2-dehydro-3-deoxygalactonokinase